MAPVSPRRACTLVLAAALLGISGCSSIVNRMAFQPKQGRETRFESEWGRTIALQSDEDVTIEAFWFESPGATRALLFFHGNAGHAGHRFGVAQAFRDLGVHVLLVSYRGYGNSEGKPSEAGLYRDGRAALEYLQEELGVPPERIVVYGRSIGSTVAVEVARGEPIAGLALVTPLSSGRDFASHHGYGWLSWLTGRPFDNVAKLPEVSAPLLVIHGDNDRITPLWMGERVLEAAGDRGRLHILRGTGHNDLARTNWRSYLGAIASFLEEVAPTNPSLRGG